MSDRLKRNVLVALGFVFCLGALAMAVQRTWEDVQPVTVTE
ncbi:hypothetical protein [Loktanella sp. M215]|nr:hypothetical protein [Loktanella sp. M215]